jgi:hypothetical protein
VDETKNDTPVVESYKYNTRSQDKVNEPVIVPLTETSLKEHTAKSEKKKKSQIPKAARAKTAVAQAKQEYKDAGGTDEKILAKSFRTLGRIRAETILLQNKK